MTLRLRPATRLWLRRLDRKTRDAEVRVRCRVLLKVAAGVTRNAAARELGCTPSTAVRIVACFASPGEAALMDGRSENGHLKVDDDVRAGICKILEQSPPDFGFPRPTWTLELLARVIQQVLQVGLSVGHVWKILKRRNATWLFLNLLRALLDAYRWARRIHLILDNYVIHKSRLTQAWLGRHGAKLRLHFLPPYCPNENRIERLWLDLHANVTRNHRCRTIEALLRAVHGYLARRFDLAQTIAYAA